MPAPKSDSTYALPHPEVCCSCIWLRVGIIFFPLLALQANAAEGWRQTGALFGLHRYRQNWDQPLGLPKAFFLTVVLERRVPPFSGGVQSTREWDGIAVSSTSQLFARGKSACGARRINCLYSWADWCHWGSIPKAGIHVLRLPESVRPSQPSPAPGRGAAGQGELLAAPGGSPVLAKSHCCLQTRSRLRWSSIKGEREVKPRTRPASPGWTAGLAVRRKKGFLLLNRFGLDSLRIYRELTRLSPHFSLEGVCTCTDHPVLWAALPHKPCSDFSEGIIFPLI